MTLEDDCLFLHVPRWGQGRREVMVMPLGVPALANFIEDESGVQPAIWHLGIEREVDPGFSLRSALLRKAPRLLFLSLHWSLQTRAVINAAQRIRAWMPDAKIVLGGLTASAFAREILEQLPFVDGVVRGDGELPALALVRTLQRPNETWGDRLEAVPNLVWRDRDQGLHDNGLTFWLDEALAGKLRHGSLSRLQNRVAYLERALYADFSEGAEEGGYARAAYLNAGRGCSVTCVNCGGAAPAQQNLCGRQGVLLYPQTKLERDVRDAVEQGARVLRMSFDPPAARQHLRRWFKSIEACASPLRLVYDLWHLPSQEFLDSLVRAFEPGSTLILSPECGSEDVRYRLRGLPFTNHQLLKAIRAIEARGFRAHCFFSAGLPTETLQDLEQSVSLIDRLRTETNSGVSVCPMVVDPGSPLFRNPERYGATLSRQTLRDFYDEAGVAGGPGYSTGAFSELDIMAACDRLLRAAGLPETFSKQACTPSAER